MQLWVRRRAEPKDSERGLILRDCLCVCAIAGGYFLGREHALTSGESGNRAELARDADAHILRCRRRHGRAAACTFTFYINAAQQFRLCGSGLGQFDFVIAAIGRGVRLRCNEKKGRAQSGGSGKCAQTG